MTSQLKQWLNLAANAPSGDNCQPWDIATFDHQIRISINLEHAKNFLDQNHCASWIAIGAFCENLRLSAAHFGFQCSWTMESATSILVRYSEVPPQKNESIVDAIQKRQTSRVPLGKTDVDLVQEYNKRYPDSRTDSKWKFKKSVSWGQLYRWAWVEAKVWIRTSLMADFVRYLHFRFEPGMVDGLTLENLQVPPMDALVLRICKRHPGFMRFVPFPTFFLQTLFRIYLQVKRSSGLMYLSGNFKIHQDYFESGREIQRMWLLMAEKNIKAQPMSVQSMYLNFAGNASDRDPFFTAKERAKFVQIRAKAFAEMQVERDMIFMFRFGTTDAKIAHLPRRPIS